jgi:hypothetical protein
MVLPANYLKTINMIFYSFNPMNLFGSKNILIGN